MGLCTAYQLLYTPHFLLNGTLYLYTALVFSISYVYLRLIC